MHSREGEFAVGTKVRVYNNQRGDKWLPGTVFSKEGSVTYHVEMTSGGVCKCHTDQLRVRGCKVSAEASVPSSLLAVTLSLAPSSDDSACTSTNRDS